MQRIFQSSLVIIFFLIVLTVIFPGQMRLSYGQTPVQIPRVNIPYLGATSPSGRFEPDIFWFGQVDPTSNYIDVRSWYYDSYMKIVGHIIDRRLWYDPTPEDINLTDYDAIVVYLNINGNTGSRPTSSSYKFIKQLELKQGDQSSIRAMYRGNETDWTRVSDDFIGRSSWRGNYPNDDVNDKGWVAEFQIPFASFGLTEKPADGTLWGIAMELYDRDDAAGTPIPVYVWPDGMDSHTPSTWAQLYFNRPTYVSPQTANNQSVKVRHGLNGAVVPDAHVGGDTVCGATVDHWSQWGYANYAGHTQMNIQNQWDISDYPCFSKYYVTFPLDQIPAGKTIVSGTVTLRLFGNAGGGEYADPFPSEINAMVVDRDWDEATVNWNNGPHVLDTLSVTKVNPVQIEPAKPYVWDVGRGLADAYAKGEPLRLAFYSTDGDYHSGKYFWTSDVDQWMASDRPTLDVIYGDAVVSPTLPQPLPGDTNGDGRVTITDLSALLSLFGQRGTGLSADFDRDGDVDIKDLATLLSNFGR